MSETVVVTGAGGFIGTNFVRFLLRHSVYHVVATDRNEQALKVNLEDREAEYPHRLLLVREDVGEIDNPLDLSSARAVVHLAASTHVDQSIDDPDVFVQDNVVAHNRLLAKIVRQAAESGRTFPHLIHVSTDEVTGDRAGRPAATEQDPLEPSSPYAASKAAAESLVRAYGRTYGLPWTIVRPANNYGPFQHPEKLIPRVIELVRRGEQPQLYGDGQQCRSWIHVEDFAKFLFAALAGRPSGRILHVPGESATNRQIVEYLLFLLSEKLDGIDGMGIRYVGDRPGHDERYEARQNWDPSELPLPSKWPQYSLFGTVDTRPGLAETADWYLTYRSKVQQIQESTGRGTGRQGVSR